MLVLKDVLDLVQNLLLQGGEEFQPDKYLTDNNLCYPSHSYNVSRFNYELLFKFCHLMW